MQFSSFIKPNEVKHKSISTGSVSHFRGCIQLIMFVLTKLLKYSDKYIILRTGIFYNFRPQFKVKMTEKSCPNFNSCRLVNLQEFATGEVSRDEYLESYCVDGPQDWERCKRFQIKKMMGFCPDFVLPDSTFTFDEIIEKFDNEESFK